MSNDLGTAVIRFNSSTKDAEAGIDRLNGKLNNLKGTTENSAGIVSRTLSGVGTAAVGIGVAALAGFGVLAYKVNGAIDRLAELSKTARDVGTEINTLKSLNYVAAQFSVSASSMATALKKLNDTFPEQDSADVLLMMREQMAGIADPSERATYAYQMLGESAEALYPILTASNEEFAKYSERAKNFNVGDNLQVEKVEEAKQAMDRLAVSWKFASDAFYEGMAVKIAPLITWLAEKLESWFADTSAGAELIEAAWSGFNAVLNFTVDCVQSLGVVWYFVQSAITKGIAVIVSGLSYLVKALDYVMESVTGEASNMAESFDAVAESLHKLSGEQWDKMKAKAAAPWWSTQMQKELKDIENRPAKPKSSWDRDFIPSTADEEAKKKAAGEAAAAPQAVIKNSSEAIQLIAKFRNGELVNKKSDKDKIAEKQLLVQQQIRDGFKAQKPPQVASF